MKLDTPRTIRVGFAFLSICAFWQLYDNVVPLVLKNTFHMPDGPMGIIMALDNILALFLLPFFGALSDKTSTRFGRRTPFIVGDGSRGEIAVMGVPGLQQVIRSVSLGRHQHDRLPDKGECKQHGNERAPGAAAAVACLHWAAEH